MVTTISLKTITIVSLKMVTKVFMRRRSSYAVNLNPKHRITSDIENVRSHPKQLYPVPHRLYLPLIAPF